MRTRIQETDLFDREGLAQVLKISQRAISREIRLKRLRCSMRCKKQWFTGKQVIEWIAGRHHQDAPHDPPHELVPKTDSPFESAN